MKRMLGLLAVMLAPATAAAQVTLEPGESVTVKARAIIDTVTKVDTIVALDTVYACPPDWTCTESNNQPPIPSMYVAGYSDGQVNGLRVEWAGQPADSFIVHGGQKDGTDTWSVTLPGTDTLYLKPLSYTAETAVFACVAAVLNDMVSGDACDDMLRWAPLARPTAVDLVWGPTWGQRQNNALDGAVLPGSFFWGINNPADPVDHVECYLDTRRVRTEFSAPWDCRGGSDIGWPLASGEHSFRARVFRADGTIYADQSVTAMVAP